MYVAFGASSFESGVRVSVNSSSSQGGYSVLYSDNGGDSFSALNGTASFEAVPSGQVLPRSGVKRMVYDVSKVKNSDGAFSVVACAVDDNDVLAGVYLSGNNGLDWTEIASGRSSALHPFSNSADVARGQGSYDATISFHPNDPNKFFIGGVELYGYNSGNWSNIATNGSGGLASIKHVHADQHEFEWDSQGRLYIGSDGGVTVSEDGLKFLAHNRGYNVTQFYDIGIDRFGAVAGGTQDNGTLYNVGTATDYSEMEFTEILGGDGFTTYLSDINSEAAVVTSQFSFFARRNNKQLGWDYDTSIFSKVMIEAVKKTNKDKNAFSGGSSGQPFFTVFDVFENRYDKNTKDRVVFLPKKEYKAGDSVSYESPTLKVVFDTVTPSYSSRFVLY